jgi:CubicO group peptidase (beta-lactamase class C family)
LLGPYNLAVPGAFPQITALLEAEAPQFGGCELVLRRGGSEVYQRSFGGYLPGARVYTASATKWTTAAVLLRLCGEPRYGLSLGSRPAELLPGWGVDDIRKSNITLRMLLSHTSGLPGVIPAVNDKSLSLLDCAMQIGRSSLSFEPGGGFFYGECGMQVAGAMAEAVSGLGWHELFAQQIAQPLSLPAMSFAGALGVLPRNPHLGAGLHCTAQDYSLFLQALWDSWSGHGGRAAFIRRELLAEMFADQTAQAARPFAYTPYILLPLHSSLGYGLGCWREAEAQDGTLRIAGSTGKPGTHPWIDFAAGICGALWFQSDFIATNDVYERVRSIAREG